MGILSRMIAVIRANLNALLNRAEDPTKMLDQTVVDMENAFRKAKDQVARSVADQKRLGQSLSEQLAQAAKWGERAVLAVQKGDDNLAREALQRKQEHNRMAVQYQHELEAQTVNVDKLKASLRDLETKIGEIRRKKNLLVSKQRRADAQDSIYQTLEGIHSAGALDTIERMENKIEDMAAMADARMEMSQEFRGDELEKKFQALGPPQDVEAELLELKQRARIEHKSKS